MTADNSKTLTPEDSALLVELANQLIAFAQSGDQSQAQPVGIGKGDSPGCGNTDNEKLAAIKAIIDGGGSMEEVAKAISEIKENPQGITARDPAEVQLQSDSAVNTTNLDEVAKSGFLQGIAVAKELFKPGVQPAPQNQNTLTVLKSAMESFLKPITDKMKQQEEFNNAILKSLGFADSVVNSVQVPTGNTVRKELPVGNLDSEIIAKEILAKLGKTQTVAKSGDQLVASLNPLNKFKSPSMQARDEVRKNLEESLSAAMGQNRR